MDLGELVGLLLGTLPVYAAARIAVDRPRQPVDEYRVTVRKGSEWVIQRGRTTHRISPDGTTIERDGREVEQGPPMRLEGLPPVFLLMPRYALIFGRPGEDWRLTNDIADGDGILSVRLRHVEHDDMTGSAVVDKASGVLRQLVLDDTTWSLAEVTFEPVATRG